MKYIPRAIEPALKKAIKQSPSLIVTGPRQSGKTTLLQHLFGKTHRYVTLDHPDIRLLAKQDPGLFLANYPPPVIIDEVQYAPEIFSYLKIHIDQHRHRKGQFLLTGSQNFSMMKGVSESLAGRIAIFSLLSLSLSEQFVDKKLTLDTLKTRVLRGGYPEVAIHKNLDVRLWFNNYIQTYLERDIRQLSNIGDLTDFQRFLELLASFNGQVLNLSSLARDLGVAVNTVKNWLSLLEASHQIILVKPYFRNKGKRIMKSPKVYFLDTGLVCFLNGLSQKEQVFKGPLSGQLFENVVLGELVRKVHMQGALPRIYWWRTSQGAEVDFIVEQDRHLVPIEVKMTGKVNEGLIKNLASFCELFQEEIQKGLLITLSGERLKMTKCIETLPIDDFVLRK